jgi:hypothetical protein
MTENVIRTMDREEAEDIFYDKEILLAVQNLRKHRWYTRQLVVFRHGSDLNAFYYLDPASENQEDQERFESNPVEIFAVKTVPSVSYETI